MTQRSLGQYAKIRPLLTHSQSTYFLTYSTHTRSLNQSISLTHTLTSHSLTHTLTSHSLTHTLTSQFYMYLEDVSITDLTFGREFMRAVEMKQVTFQHTAITML